MNAVKTIEECISSVIGQTYGNLEFVVIDGGSTDGTLAILERYRSQIDYFVSEPDRGIYNAMNKGIDAATGDYVHFLNSDDKFCDVCVVADVAEAINKCPEIDLVYGDVLLLSSGDGLVRKSQTPVLSRESLCRKGFCHQALFARREILLRTGGFSEEYQIVADGDWLARALSAGATSIHLERDIAVYRLGGYSGTNVRWREEKRRMLRANFTSWELFRWRKLPGIFGRNY